MIIKVINAGNCILCGREIKITVRRGNNKFPDIFFCPECEQKVKKAESQESEEK